MATLQQSQPVPTCPVCNGTRWKKVVVSGKADRVTRCDCYFADRSARLLKASQIPVRYQHCTLDNVEIINQSIATAVSDMKHFVEHYPNEKTGPLLMGRPGVGKTHLAVAAIQSLMLKGIACLFCDYRELLKEIQNTYNASVQITELEILRPVFEIEVLLLDELGAIRPSDWVWDTVSHILNYRYNEKKTTIITTNFVDGFSRLSEEAKKKPEPVSHNQTAAEWAMRDETLADRITDRMYSRLHEMCRIMRIQGSDFRRVTAGFIVRVIPVRQKPANDLVGVLQARSLQTGDYWLSPPLQWDEIYKYLRQMGQTELQIEAIESSLLRGKAANITEKPEPMRVSDYQVRKMQMKPTMSTEP